jgi:hypothetical protein
VGCREEKMREQRNAQKKRETRSERLRSAAVKAETAHLDLELRLPVVALDGVLVPQPAHRVLRRGVRETGCG